MKLLTRITADEIYGFPEKEGILPEEQKGCRRKSKSTGDQLYIEKMLLQEVKRRMKNLAMGWIDYRKAYDMVPHSLVIESLKMMGIAKNVVKFLGKMVKSWRVELTCGSETLGEVPIKRGIFQGDALSPLHHTIPLTHILRTANPGYEFRTGETINQLLFMDDLKLYFKSEKALESLIQKVRIFSEDIGM